MSEENIWYKCFGLNQNPFNTSPLNKNQIDLFYKTSEISKKNDPLLSELSTNVPSLKLVIGPKAVDNREYEGKVINVKENIALLSAKDFYVYVHGPDRLLKIAVQ